MSDNNLEVLDGQQRITSIGRFVTNKFAIKDDNGKEWIFDSLPEDKKQQIKDTIILFYECKGTETEIKEWFKTINCQNVRRSNQKL